MPSKRGQTTFKLSKNSSNTGQRQKGLKFHEYKVKSTTILKFKLLLFFFPQGPPDVVKAAAKQQQTPEIIPPTCRSKSLSATAAKEHLEAIINQQSLYLKYQKYK